ncbi:MAG: DUF4143 domain-containing protein [Streptococcaceae bacterium]|jgi:predicted AAA+ superfamily ATPase|nr:DUF4143 domain-containing protein [Streptococcaceae bacterium]
MYLKRHVDTLLQKYIENFPVILIEGAKAVGKTSTCENIAKTSYYLDEPLHYEVLSSIPDILQKDIPPILIDEWQKLPSIWEYSRRAVDRGLSAGFLLLTGSSPKINANIHSGAGRIVRLKMRPFTIEERQISDVYIRISDFLDVRITDNISERTNKGLVDYLDEIFRSGLPGIRDKSEYARKGFLKSYVDNLAEKEFIENGFSIKKPDSLHSWLKAYASAIASVTNFQTILDASMRNSLESPSRKTADNYKDILVTLNVIEELPAWLGYGKLFPALAKASKHFLLDPALVAPLLGMTKSKILKGDVPHPIGKMNKTFLGQLFESLIYQSLITYAEINGARLSHLRMKNGRREIDFIIEKEENNQLIAIEVKSASSISDKDVEHLNWFEEIAKKEYKTTKVVLYMGSFAFTRKDQVHVIPASMLGV